MERSIITAHALTCLGILPLSTSYIDFQALASSIAGKSLIFIDLAEKKGKALEPVVIQSRTAPKRMCVRGRCISR